jgi:3-oxoacyl-[acyl-carrier-protein] synthase-3
MKCTFKNKRISSIIAVAPSQEYRFDDEYHYFKMTEAQAKRFKKTIGLDRHRIAPPDVCASDLCLFGVHRLLDAGILKKEDIDAVVFISQTPDYILPATSNVLHGKLGLDHDVICLDINQGCAGYLTGLQQACLLLEIPAVSKVLLLTGDTSSKLVDRRNRISYPITGDAGAATVIERCPEETTIYMDVKNDGSRYKALMILGGAYRMPSSVATLELREVEEGVVKCLEHADMDGAAIFNFTMDDVPPQIEEVLAFSGDTRESIQHFFLHQPNPFIVTQMAQKMKIPAAKVPNNVVSLYGNCSSTTIPLNIALNAAEPMLAGTRRVCLSGFGVGLTWISAVMDLGPLDFCKLVDYEATGSHA